MLSGASSWRIQLAMLSGAGDENLRLTRFLDHGHCQVRHQWRLVRDHEEREWVTLRLRARGTRRRLCSHVSRDCHTARHPRGQARPRHRRPGGDLCCDPRILRAVAHLGQTCYHDRSGGDPRVRISRAFHGVTFATAERFQGALCRSTWASGKSWDSMPRFSQRNWLTSGYGRSTSF